MIMDFLVDAFREQPERPAIVWHDHEYTYGDLARRIDDTLETLHAHRVPVGAAVALEAGYSPAGVASLLALAEHGCIAVPLAIENEQKKEEYRELSSAEFALVVDGMDEWRIVSTGRTATHDLYTRLREAGHPGLVLYSSGSTGKSKAAVHDFVRLLAKFRKRRKDFRTLAFLMFDHIGGIDALFYALSNMSCVVTVAQRTPDAICAAIERHGVQVLPTTPTFMNLLALSEAYRRHDTSSVKYVAYGSEVMTSTTLARTREMFPNAILQQKFGTTETGALRSKSRDSESNWVKLGGDEHAIRVVDGILQIKAESAMLGYLNAPNPFTDDGWFITGDAVETDGDYVRIVGRRSDIVNIGGEKVYPAEVESTIQELANIEDVTVHGEPNAFAGSILVARVRLSTPESLASVTQRIQLHCLSRLQRYKVPAKVILDGQHRHGERFKKSRLTTPNTDGIADRG